jgi:preprotein translocase subunit SecA
MLPFPELTRRILEVKNRALLGSLNQKVQDIAANEKRYRRMSDADLRLAVAAIAEHVRHAGAVDQYEIQLFSIIREAAARTVGMFPFEVQLLGALALRRGHIIQMDTGEGKTLVAPFAAIAEALTGRRLLVVTANPYLAERDAHWMGPLYEFFDIPVTFVDRNWNEEQKYEAYSSPLVYCSTLDLIFDYLRAHGAVSRWGNFPISRYAAIIDEIDNVLLDQGTRPHNLIMPMQFDSPMFTKTEALIEQFLPNTHFEANRKLKTVQLTAEGRDLLERLLPEAGCAMAEFSFFVRNALIAHHTYRRNVDYILDAWRIVLVDQITGLPRPGSTLPFGLQQAIEEKEGIPRTAPHRVVNEITVEGFYSGFAKISGMSGSALHNAVELKLVYKLDVIPIPPRSPCIRKDTADKVYRTKSERNRATVEEIKEAVEAGRPVLVGTLNIEDTDGLADLLDAADIPHYVLTARNSAEEAELMASAGEPRRVTIAAKLAGRGVDIKLTPESRTAGGLHVIGAGRNDDRRLDGQLTGRSGRQGDPGSSRFILSLEDELLAIFGGVRMQQLMLRLGMEDMVPIESDLITRRISAAQRTLTRQSFYQRQTSLLFEQFLNKSRSALFSRRDLMATATSFHLDIAELFQRFVHYLSALGGKKPAPLVEAVRDQLGIELSPEFWALHGDNESIWNALVEELTAAYAERKKQAGPAAAVRERIILLRSIDYCWSHFIDDMQKRFDSLRLGQSELSTAERIAELAVMFAGEVDKITSETDATSIFNLMRIAAPGNVTEIRYWWIRGPIGGAEWTQLNARALPLLVSEAEGRDEGLLTLFDPGNWQEARTEPLELFIRAHIDDLDAQDVGRKQYPRTLRMLASYEAFVTGRNYTLADAPKSVDDFLETTRNRRWLPLRRRDKQVVADFLMHLRRQGFLEGAAEELPELPRFEGQPARILKNLTFSPAILLQTAYLIAFVLLVHVITRYPLPPWSLASSPNLMPSLATMPSQMFRMIDDLLLGGAAGLLGAGIVGILPMAPTEWFIAGLWRSKNATRLQNILLYLPGVMFGAAIVVLFLFFTHAIAHPAGWLNGTEIFLAVCAGSFLMIFLVWIAQFTELPDGLSLLLFVTTSTLLWSAAGAPGSPLDTHRWTVLGFLAIVCLLMWGYHWSSRVRLNIVRFGRFDFLSGDLKTAPTTLAVETVYDGYHYLGAGLFAAIVGPRVGGFSASANAAIALPLPWPTLVAYFAALSLLLYGRMRYRLSEASIQHFLDEKYSAIDGASSAEGMRKLLRAIRRTYYRNCAWEFMILVTVLAGIRLAAPEESGLFGVTPLEQVVVVSLWCFLLLALARQFRSLVIAPTASRIVNLRVHVEQPEDEPELPAWRRQLQRLLKREQGTLEILGALALLLELGTHAMHFFEWVLGVTGLVKHV